MPPFENSRVPDATPVGPDTRHHLDPSCLPSGVVVLGTCTSNVLANGDCIACLHPPFLCPHTLTNPCCCPLIPLKPDSSNCIPAFRLFVCSVAAWRRCVTSSSTSLLLYCCYCCCCGCVPYFQAMAPVTGCLPAPFTLVEPLSVFWGCRGLVDWSQCVTLSHTSPVCL